MSLIYTVPQNHVVVIERFGKFKRIQTAGINFKIPFFESIRRVDIPGSNWGGFANKESYKIELSEQSLDTTAKQYITKDNANVSTNAVVAFRIVDVRKAVYEVDDLPSAVMNGALNALRSIIGGMELDDAIAKRQQINDLIASQLSELGGKWGVQFMRVEVQELITDDSTSAAMLQQLQSERSRRAEIAQAKGRAEAEVTVARAEAEAAIIRAEGQAAALEIMAKADALYASSLMEVMGGKAADVVMAQKYMSGFEVISRNPAEKVYLPNSFKGILAIGDEG
ncbi:paraslipin [Akkermansiaceae bacterium]|nr:paraslipin [Akkermansiaceae bacterium]